MGEYESWTAFYMRQTKEADEVIGEVNSAAGNKNSNVDQVELTLLFVRLEFGRDWTDRKAKIKQDHAVSPYLKNCPTGRPGHLNIKTNTNK